MKRIQKWLIILAVVLLGVVSVRTALAYFFVYTDADGKIPVVLNYSTKITEPEVVEGDKHLVISAQDNTDPVYVRVIVYADSDADVDITVSDNPGWTQKEDGYWYYNKPLDGINDDDTYAQTADLHVHVAIPAGEKGDQVNVIIVHEAAPCIYDEASGELTADWSKVIFPETGTETGGGN